MYLPFFSAAVQCGAAALDIADRRNAHTQSVIWRDSYTLFRLVDRKKELHREINGFSISHSDVDVRVWAKYEVIDGDNVKYYRHPIRKFYFTELFKRERWTVYAFVRSIYDLWLPKHFKRIYKIIDLLPADFNFDVSEKDPGSASSASSRSGLSHWFESYSVDGEELVSTTQLITRDTTIGAKSPSLQKGEN